MEQKLLQVVFAVILMSYIVVGNPMLMYGESQPNYFMAAMPQGAVHAQPQQQQQQQYGEQRGGEKPVIIVQHVHKEEIDEERVRIGPPPQPHSVQHQQAQPNTNPFYLIQVKMIKHQQPYQMANPNPNHHAYYYGQGYGGYAWKSASYQ